MQHHGNQPRCAFVRQATSTATVLLLVLSSTASVSGAARPNLLFIIADQHCADVRSCAGDESVQTPSLDRLAQHGVRFTRAYVTHPLSIPSRASFITGKMPTQCQTDVQLHTSLGSIMKQAGYDTGYFGKWHIQPRRTESNLSWHGFDDVRGRAVMSGRLKYIVYSEGQRPEQLFDLESDPGEMNSLVAHPDYQAELQRHRELLQDWTDSIGDSFSLAHLK